MGKTEILEEVSKLSHKERREIIRHMIEMEDEDHILEDCDRRADERFQMLDQLEAEDGEVPSE